MITLVATHRQHPIRFTDSVTELTINGNHITIFANRYYALVRTCDRNGNPYDWFVAGSTMSETCNEIDRYADKYRERGLKAPWKKACFNGSFPHDEAPGRGCRVYAGGQQSSSLLVAGQWSYSLLRESERA